jgi:sec-independent protein translocase protein TatA
MLPNVGATELLVIFVIALIVVGPKRLPEIGRTIGRGLNEFRKLQDEVRDMVKFDLSDDVAEPATRMELPEVSDTDDDGDEDRSGDEVAPDEGEGTSEPLHSARVFDLGAADETVTPMPSPPSDEDLPLPPAASAE